MSYSTSGFAFIKMEHQAQTLHWQLLPMTSHSMGLESWTSQLWFCIQTNWWFCKLYLITLLHAILIWNSYKPNLLNFGENLSLYCKCVCVCKPHLVKRKRHLLCICLCVCLGTGHTEPHKTVHNTRQFTLFYDFSKSRIGQSACFPSFILV